MRITPNTAPAPSPNSCRHHDDGNSSSSEPHLVISSYGMVQSRTGCFIDEDSHGNPASTWDYVVLDEAHQVKNPNAKRTKCCRRICGEPASNASARTSTTTRRLMLTGTPILNDLTVRLSRDGNPRIGFRAGYLTVQLGFETQQTA